MEAIDGPRLHHNEHIFLQAVPFRGGHGQSSASIQPSPLLPRLSHPQIKDITRHRPSAWKTQGSNLVYTGYHDPEYFWIEMPIVASKPGAVCICTLVSLQSTFHSCESAVSQDTKMAPRKQI